MKGYLPTVSPWLSLCCVVLYVTIFHCPLFSIRRVKFDRLDKAFCILKLDTTGLGHSDKEEEEGKREITTAAPLIRRVDLIVCQPEQYPFALVSWTGSKVVGLYSVMQLLHNQTLAVHQISSFYTHTHTHAHSHSHTTHTLSN